MIDFTWEEDRVLPLPPLKIQHGFSGVHSIDADYGPSVVTSSRVALAWDPGGKMGEQYDPCTEKHSTVYFNLAEVQKALHVNPVIGNQNRRPAVKTVNTHWGDCERSMLHIYH
jgi:hypothetical protein